MPERASTRKPVPIGGKQDRLAAAPMCLHSTLAPVYSRAKVASVGESCHVHWRQGSSGLDCQKRCMRRPARSIMQQQTSTLALLVCYHWFAAWTPAFLPRPYWQHHAAGHGVEWLLLINQLPRTGLSMVCTSSTTKRGKLSTAAPRGLKGARKATNPLRDLPTACPPAGRTTAARKLQSKERATRTPARVPMSAQ